MSRVPGETRVRQKRVKHCSSLIAATWANESEPEDDDNCTVRVQVSSLQCSTSAFASAAASQHASLQCFGQLRPSPHHSANAPWPSQRGDRPLKRPRQPSDDITLRQSAEDDRICPRYNPQAAQQEEKTKTRNRLAVHPQVVEDRSPETVGNP